MISFEIGPASLAICYPKVHREPSILKMTNIQISNGHLGFWLLGILPIQAQQTANKHFFTTAITFNNMPDEL